MKRIITTFLLCLSLGCLFLHADRGKHIHETPEKQPDFITGFKYLPPGFECFADMFKYKVIDFPGFSKPDTLYFKKYTQPVNGYMVKTVTRMSYVLKKGTKNSLSAEMVTGTRKYA